MSLKTERWARKPFEVDVVKVTKENMVEVAKWCDGTIDEMESKGRNEYVKYIRVRVLRPLNERQTRAFVGDYVLYTKTGYKVYPEKAFKSDFERAEDVEPESNGHAPSAEAVVVDGTALSQEALGLLKGISELSQLLPPKSA